MSKKTKKRMKTRTKVIIGVSIAILLLLLLFVRVTPQTVILSNITGGTTSGGGTSGGTSGGGTSGGTDWNFPSFNFPSFDFKMPCFWNCGTPDSPTPSTPIDTSRLPSLECTKNSDCNKCANANYDTCEKNKCICKAPTETGWFFSLPLINVFVPQVIVPITFECIEDTDCNKCANPAYDNCNSEGKCDCVAPVERTEEIDREPVIPECSRDSDCNKCANPDYDDCVDGVCKCNAPEVEETGCEDSDASRESGIGVNYGLQGTCLASSTSRGVTDSCGTLSTTLNEYYCRSSTQCDIVQINCETEYGRGYFCLDGFCTTTA